MQNKSSSRLVYLLFISAQFGFGSEARAYLDEVQQPLVDFSAYKPTYFIVGIREAKAQVSLKIRPLTVVPLYLAYSQLMIWDIFDPSAPIRDVNYNPEIFYRFELKKILPIDWIDLGPLEHESNGQGSRGSRSWNRAYVRVSGILGPRREVSPEAQPASRLVWSLKFWTTYSSDEEDWKRSRGLVEATFDYSGFRRDLFDRSDLMVRIYPGGQSGLNPTLGGQEVSLRLKFKALHDLPLVVAQAFHGTGENLLEVQDVRTVFRLGIGL